MLSMPQIRITSYWPSVCTSFTATCYSGIKKPILSVVIRWFFLEDCFKFNISLFTHKLDGALIQCPSP